MFGRRALCGFAEIAAILYRNNCPMILAELERLLNELVTLPKETEWVEFKVNNSNPQEIGEYLSALSNSSAYHRKSSGYLVYGIEDGSHKLVGTSFKPSMTKVGNQELENWLATQLNPRIDFVIHEVELHGKSIVIFKVDATKHQPVDFRGNAFIRIGSYKKSLDEHPNREKKIWQDDKEVFEEGICLKNLSDDKVLELLDYPTFFELLKRPLPSNKKGILEKLEEERVIVSFGGKFDITNLGGILFAKNINSFESLSRKALRVIIYKGKNRIHTVKEQVGGKGYAVGFEGFIDYIEGQLPTNEEIGKAFRNEVPIYPILSIRELVANAIIHQDFSISGTSPMVEIFENRIEITNSGKPLINPLRFIDHSPQSRNEMLARVMRRLNICEERGSGIDKVIFECELYQLPAPDFIEGDNFLRVILYAPKSLREMNRQDKVRASYQHSCLKYVSGEMMSNQTLRERFQINENNYPIVSRIIADSIEDGLIKPYDIESKSKKFARYVPFWC